MRPGHFLFSAFPVAAPGASRPLFVAAAFLFLAFFPQSDLGQSLLLDESFENSTAPGWVFQGSVKLTNGNADPSGAGWLRLTPTGFAYLNQPDELAIGENSAK